MADQRGADAAGYLGWFLFGAMAGAAAALLLTPKTGQEARELLTEQGSEWWRRAQERAGGTQARAGDLFDKGRDYFETQRERLASAFDAGRSAMKDEISRAGTEL